MFIIISEFGAKMKPRHEAVLTPKPRSWKEMERAW